MLRLFVFPLLAGVVFSTFVAPVSAANPREQNMMNAVLKIKTYQRDTISGNYQFTHWGSAVVLDRNRILTNAHVILDADGKNPTGYYELCRAEKGKADPVCFATAKLQSYDTVADLALLTLSTPIRTAKTLGFSDRSLSIGSSMIVYGYPAIGGRNITRTEGKIGGNEGDEYKFDGTIDRGNSGWGAFDRNGKLIGVPYAVNSDNGVIGYIIPISRVKEFLAGKSYDNVIYSSPQLTEFINYTRLIQSVFRDENLLKTPYIELKDLGKSGFTLKNAIVSLDGKIFDYRFIDKNERVMIGFQCGKISSKEKSYRAIVEDSLDDLDNPPTVSFTGAFLDTEKKYYIVTMTTKKEVNGQRPIYSSILYTDAPTCETYIIADDGMKKDKALYEKALYQAKNVRFSGTGPIEKSFSSAFFSNQALPDGVMISESSKIGESTIFPQIRFELGKDYSTSSAVDVYEYESLDDYMNIGFYDESDYYKEKVYTFDAFLQRYKANNDTSVIQEISIRSANLQKMIFTVIDEYPKATDASKKKYRVVIYYPFLDGEKKYRAYRWSFGLPGTDMNHVNMIKNLFETLTLPGSSPFSL